MAERGRARLGFHSRCSREFVINAFLNCNVADFSNGDIVGDAFGAAALGEVGCCSLTAGVFDISGQSGSAVSNRGTDTLCLETGRRPQFVANALLNPCIILRGGCLSRAITVSLGQREYGQQGDENETAS